MTAEEKRARARAASGRWRGKNRAKCVASSLRWAKLNPERKRAYDKRRRNTPAGKAKAKVANWRRQGIDPAQALAALAANGGTCDLCGAGQPGGHGTWHVDHNHSTGVVRGAVCYLCNSMLGRIERIGLGAIKRYIQRVPENAGNKE